ncbi:MAG: hypothetical protein KC776_12275 [Myxococcales bacterium]|nr:hypothetical protein [Myxococcales bacterium]MCB9580996.1 hypothetical protein [Polyangiaceae bacterium]
MSRPTNPVEYRAALGIRPFSPWWETFVRAFYGIPLLGEQRALFRQMSNGIEERPGVGWTEAFVNAGRGSGKDDTVKSLVTYECRFGGHELAAAPGQRLPALVVCPRRTQATGTVAMVQGEARLPVNRKHVVRETTDGLWFANGTGVQVATADAIDGVGETAAVLVFNEYALFPSNDATTPAAVVESNLRPTLRRVEGAPVKRFLKLTSSYTTETQAFKDFTSGFGIEGDVLVVKGTTLECNPNTDREWLASERRRLGARLYGMHYECEWIDAIREGWFGAQAIERSVDQHRRTPDREDIQSRPGVRYYAAIDQAFRNDRWTLAIAHREQEHDQDLVGRVPREVVDGVWVWQAPPGGVLSVERTVRQTAQVMKRFGCGAALADQFAFEPLREAYARANIVLRLRPWTAANKAPRFRRVRDHMLDRLVRLPNDPELIREFHGIAGKLLPSGVEQIAASGSGHDDRVSAVVLVLSEAIDRNPDAEAYIHEPAIFYVTRDGVRIPPPQGLYGAERTRRFLNDEFGDFPY